jgi:hypothetical protein
MIMCIFTVILAYRLLLHFLYKIIGNAFNSFNFAIFK